MKAYCLRFQKYVVNNHFFKIIYSILGDFERLGGQAFEF